MLKRTISLLLAAVALVSAAPLTTAQVENVKPIAASFNLAKDNLAIKGYDPVAYFEEGGGKPKKGDAKITAMYRGATYRFANAQNRARFLAAPSRYEPAYGGWCAYAMASDDRVEVDPKSFRIEDGSLLLFYNGFLANTRKKWGKEGSDKLFPKADANWFKFSSEMRKREAAAFHHENGLVIGGYDPVAYSQGAASMGDEGITVEHRGLTYRFATEANREAFLNDPDRYEPAYGGWCAYAMAKGQKVVPSPELFLQGDEGTLLFIKADSDLRAAWKNDPSLKKDADAAWAKLMSK